MEVRDLMTTDVTTVGADTSLKEVAGILAAKHVSGLPVVDGNSRVLGVISEADILEKEAGPSEKRGGILGWLSSRGHEDLDAKLSARSAEEAMTQPAITVTPGTQVAEAASIMTEKSVNRLPVVEDEKLVGIVTRADLVRAFTRADHEIKREIEQDVVLHRFWISPGSVSVTVSNGEVTLVGEVETEDTAELVSRYVARVPGVVTLNSKLHWRDTSPVGAPSPPDPLRPPS